MFFRRQQPKEITFDQRMEDLRKAGFTLTSAAGGRIMVTRDGCAAILENAGQTPRVVERAGIVMDGGIAKLVDGGFQKFFLALDERKKPALAPELKALLEFQEDVREEFSLVSLYNDSLVIVSTQYLSDRVEDRYSGVH